ncbi:hypothetical protein DL96DRAFT_1465286 [Flagelloscypha sp. PMI_526]|nr:hypothetical protein DL96DRAFT_1465286 [Flagelloscypha sp. PMI_526]
MRGISMPTHEYARMSAQHIHQIRKVPREQRNPEIGWHIINMAASTRAYTRVVLRLRAQAERMQREKDKSAAEERRGRERESKPPNSYYNTAKQSGRSVSRNSSRAPSPTQSMFSQSHHGHGGMSNHGHGGYGNRSPRDVSPSHSNGSPLLDVKPSTIFNSPLYRQRRAPLLRVFVPSPEGTWLSDASVLECEAELRRAAVMGLLRAGDIVWDVAVGDEGNVGRLIWDGSYLIDLDYTYNNVGDLPKYMPTLAFPPSYFHKVIRTSSSSANPIIHIDISPWGEEIANRLQLLQDRVRTETPQGAYHNVVRWVHRSSFVIRPPPTKSLSTTFYDPRRAQQPFAAPRIPIPGHQGLFVDSGWYGTIVVETEGTNEALADFQLRCGPAAFPAAPRGVNHGNRAVMEREAEQRRVFRILREKSRPGEIWIRTVTAKERIL